MSLIPRRLRGCPLPPHRHFADTLLVGLAIGFSGCATVPLPDLHSGLPTHWQHQLRAPARPQSDLHGWWKAFEDPPLERLVDQAVAANLDVAQALERLQAARTLHAGRQAPNLPYLRVRTDDPIDPDASASYFVVGFDASWELGLFGRATATDRLSEGKLGEAVAALREARVVLVAEVVRDWIQLRAAQRRAQLLEHILAVRRRQAELRHTRVQLSLDDPAAWADAQAAVAEAQAELSEPRADTAAAAQRLALLLGRSEPDPAWLRPTALPRLGPRGPVPAPAELLRSRPEIAGAEARVVQTAGELGIASADLYPRISLGASLLWSTNIASDRQRSTTDRIGTVGPVIDIPLFDWGMRRARADAGAHQLKAAVMVYRASVLAGMAEVETALGRLQQLGQGEDARLRACAAWQTATRAMHTRRRLGLASDLDSAEVEVARAQAELKLSATRAERDVAYVALYKALGGAPLLTAPDDRAANPGGAAR